MKTSINLLLILLAVGLASTQAQAGDLPKTVAESYGLAAFGQVEEIRYTFNVQIGDKNIRRSWAWQPKIDQVTFFEQPDKPVTYSRRTLNENTPEAQKKIDAGFINDQYWLVFPYHLVWDDKAKLEDTGSHPLPIGEGSGKRLVITYPPTGGYTPGDVYELFIDGNHRLSHWIYRRGGAPEPTRITTWEEHKTVGPLTIALSHRDKEGKFRLWFTDVAVRLTGTEGWIEAK